MPPWKTTSEVVKMNKKQIDILLKNIELLKAELELLVEEQGIDEEVIRKSKELDEYITKYYMYLKELSRQKP
ncbi:Spo0E family sporulation regulatory protein-aspartic acid phosphatase [Biomaibacter acetigenes]|uniref:Spo0E family sporulation regulatory protein-aspartic acid phosphatase n=2 Tax=Biomaibacter acetigenes TaxID=2316383 RepID=A0A3G2R5X8_9FIRM|nr:Spo0E family sporulation regulatory protein-aspartic acid phosphatase [Biomaibacter acetigenes]